VRGWLAGQQPTEPEVAQIVADILSEACGRALTTDDLGFHASQARLGSAPADLAVIPRLADALSSQSRMDLVLDSRDLRAEESDIASACSLTCAFAPCFERSFSSGGFPRVMAGCGAAVLRSWGPSGAGLAGFWCTGQAGQGRADVPESAADPGGGEPSRRGRAFPGQAQVVGEGAGEAELGVAGDDQPGPPVGGAGVADLGGGPAEDLLEQAEGVFEEQARLHA
jgi:hypothetical protein